MVCPSLFISAKSFNSSSAAFESSAPVGSSASSYQRTGNGGTLFLTARYLIRVSVKKLGYSELCGNRGYPLSHLLIILPHKHKRQKNVVPYRKSIQQIEVLKYKSKMLPAKLRR